MRRANVKDACRDFSCRSQQNPTGVHLGCAGSYCNIEGGFVQCILYNMDMLSKPLQYSRVVCRIIEINIKYLNLGICMKVHNCFLCFFSYFLGAWCGKKENEIERTGGKKRQNRPRLFLLPNQSFKKGVVKACEC